MGDTFYFPRCVATYEFGTGRVCPTTTIHEHPTFMFTAGLNNFIISELFIIYLQLGTTAILQDLQVAGSTTTVVRTGYLLNFILHTVHESGLS